MKKEHVFLVALALFAFGYVLNTLAGPASIKVINNPYSFLLDPTNLKRIPLTTFEIFIKTIALTLSVGLLFSLIERKYFLKSAIAFVIALLSQLYAIQQIMMKGSLTTMQWTLSISYAGVFTLLLVIYYIFQGIIYGINKKLIGEPVKPINRSESDSTSVLNP